MVTMTMSTHQVFWWTVEGKFGRREEALVYQLPYYVTLAAVACADGDSSFSECSGVSGVDWHMNAPGSSLALGITSVSPTSPLVVHGLYDWLGEGVEWFEPNQIEPVQETSQRITVYAVPETSDG